VEIHVPDLLLIPLRENADQSRAVVEATFASTGKHDRPPLFVPRSQLYYWTKEWQAGEAEALEDLREGRSRTFPNGTAAADFLLSDED
jgi:hypothetical protein